MCSRPKNRNCLFFMLSGIFPQKPVTNGLFAYNNQPKINCKS